MRTFTAVSVAVVVLAGLVARPARAEITVTKIVDTSTPVPGGIGNFGGFGSPSLWGGFVAFEGTGGGQNGIYSSYGGLHAVADLNTPIPAGMGSFAGFDRFSLDSGSTAFMGWDSTGQRGIYTDESGLGVIADSNSTIPGGAGAFTSVAHPVIGSGNVAFVGSGASGQKGVYSDIGGLHVVADRNTPVPGSGGGSFTGFHSSNFSFDGQSVAFLGTGPGTQAGVYSDSGGALHVVANKNTPIPGGTGTFGGFASMSGDAGNVAFHGFDGTGAQQGIYTNVGGALSLIADQTTPVPGGLGDFTGFTRGPSLDGNNVAFAAASENDTQRGIYAYFNGSLLNIIELDDMLDGKSIAWLDMSTEALDGDQLAFRVDFTDSSRGIYVATIPEPATLPLLALAALPLLRRRRQR